MSNMNTMNPNQRLVQSGRVTTEGDDLYYEVRGQGQPLLLIPPPAGMGIIMQPWRIGSVMNTKSSHTTAVPMPAVR